MSMLKTSMLPLASIAILTSVPVDAADSPPKFADQGKEWNAALRKEFYSLDEGARIMPLPWIKALKHTDGGAFLDICPTPTARRPDCR
jgi:hypothetical protein